MSEPETRWVTFTHASQALPGRRMRMYQGSHTLTITSCTKGHVFFDNNWGSLPASRLKRQRWEIDV